MNHWSEDIIEAECPECGHEHLIPTAAIGVPIVCQRCDTEFQLRKERVRHHRRPRSAYLSTLRGGAAEEPPSRNMWNATLTILGLVVLIALLALLFEKRDELAGPAKKLREIDEKYLDHR